MPRLAFFCLPIDTAPTWHLLPPPLPRCFGLAFLLVLRRWVCWLGNSWSYGLACPFLSSERPFGHAHAGSPFAYGSLDSCLPAALAFSPPLGFWLLAARSLPRSPGLVLGSRFSLAPSGHARDPEFTPSLLAFWQILVWCVAARWDWSDLRSCGGRMQPLQLCLPPS